MDGLACGSTHRGTKSVLRRQPTAQVFQLKLNRFSGIMIGRGIKPEPLFNRKIERRSNGQTTGS